jgi:hypothetical protein
MMRMERAALALLVGIGLWAMSAGTAWASDLLPDLGMATMKTVYIDTSTIPGHRLLRYDAFLANVGAGPFEVAGHRSSPTVSSMAVTQHIYQSGGGFRSVATGDVMKYFASRWRLQDLENGWLQTTSGGTIVALAKHWYCSADDYDYSPSLPGDPGHAVYLGGCGFKKKSILSVRMGLSVGWVDDYSANTPNQYIDITNVPDGTYFVYSVADPHNYFLESNESNNSTWDEVQITGDTVTILAYGPHV